MTGTIYILSIALDINCLF